MVERSTAVQRAQEPVTPKSVKFESLLDRMNEVLNDISERVFEIFERDGRVFGRELDDWLQAEREFLHSVHLQLAESGESVGIFQR